MKKREQFLNYGGQYIDEEDIQAVIETLRSPFITQGPQIAAFEKAIADYVGAKYAVAFSSGTAALHGAYYVAGVRDGDEVITTPITFVATANAALYCGAKPVFADINLETGLLDVDRVKEKITANTKVIAPVDYTGQPVDIDAFMKLAAEHNLVVIEDGAHSLGAMYNGQKIGQQADMTMFSFHPVKPITTAEGGIITTNNEEYYEKLQQFRTHGILQKSSAQEIGAWYYEMVDLGFNYRMTDVQATLGLSQLKKLDRFIARRREIAALYTKLLAEIPGVIIPKQQANVASGWHLYMIQLDLEVINKLRKQIFDAMRAANIGVHVHYIPVYWHPYYQRLGYKRGLCPQAETWYERALTLPIHYNMTDDDVIYVVDTLKKELKHYN